MANRCLGQGDGFDCRGTTPRYGDGASLVEAGTGALDEYVRQGGERCPDCGDAMEAIELEHEPRLTLANYQCSGCGLQLRHVYRLVDAF